MSLRFSKRVAIVHSPIEISSFLEARPRLNDCGGYASFAGIVRDHNNERAVRYLEYECYEALAQRELERIVDDAQSRYQVPFLEVVHRLGTLQVGDVAVFIQALAPHRREAFAAAEYTIDMLKQSVPIWKKEFYRDGGDEWTLCLHGHGGVNAR